MKAVIFFISAYWMIPKIAVTTVNVNAVTLDKLNSSQNSYLTSNPVNYQDFQETYVPPNNGGPDSRHGSGTR
ncbi:MAG: hypothetical protein EA343_21780 [Nodularia sp. (in: Bacteria)]|nr:MAG: hypothetical protein EA343_21780 [Nodularia sp. (in: cyanobacteria)]